MFAIALWFLRLSRSPDANLRQDVPAPPTIPDNFRDRGVKELVEWVSTQTAVDRVESARAELERRGLTV